MILSPRSRRLIQRAGGFVRSCAATLAWPVGRLRVLDFAGLALRAVVVALVPVIVGCGVSEGEQICALGAIPAGVTIDVPYPMPERADLVSVEQCQRRCETGSDQLDYQPTGRRGVVSFPGFERRETRVRVELESSSGEQVFRGEIVATPRMVPPFGSPRCPKGGPQIRLAVKEGGRLVTAF